MSKNSAAAVSGTLTPAEAARRNRAEALRVNKPQPEASPADDSSSEAAASSETPAPRQRKPREEKPSFTVDAALMTRLRALSSDELLAEAGERLRPVDRSNTTVLELGQNTDHFSGQPVHRSAIRGAIYDFVASRPDSRATVAEICAYMVLGAGRIYPGKFDAGYIQTARGEDSKRGMVARRLLRVVERPKPAAPEAQEA